MPPPRPRSPRPAPPRLLAGLAAVALAGCPAAPPPRPPTPVEERAAAWRADPALPRGAADELLARAAEALAADQPGGVALATAACRAVLVQDAARPEAVACLATAFADGAGDVADGQGLQEAHALLAWALAASPGRSDLMGAQARLLLLVPSARNREEALDASRRAQAGAATAAGGAGATAASSAALAGGLALLPGDPAAAAQALERAAALHPQDRRLLAAAARARWAGGDAEGALAHAEARLALTPTHPGLQELAAEVEAASGRHAEASLRLRAWRAQDPRAALPAFLLARLAAQLEGRPEEAGRLLDEASALAVDPYLLARIDALRAALALSAGDDPGAARLVAAALARVPASAPAQHQAAVLAFRRQDRAALREAAGVVGDRCGPAVAALLAARQAELGSATLDEAADAWRGWAESSPREPAVALVAGAAAARLGYTGPALALARRALALDPVEGRLRRQPVACWEGPAAIFEAIGRFEGIARAEPEAARTALLAAAACALELGLAPAAERYAGRVLAGDRRAGGARVLLAQAALDRGRPAEALRHAAAAQGLPGAEAVGGVLARALLAAGRLPEAARAAAAAAAQEEGGVADPDGSGAAAPAAPGRGGAAARLGRARLLARTARTKEASAEAAALARGLLAEDPGLSAARGLLLDLAGGRPVR